MYCMNYIVCKNILEVSRNFLSYIYNKKNLELDVSYNIKYKCLATPSYDKVFENVTVLRLIINERKYNLFKKLNI